MPAIPTFALAVCCWVVLWIYWLVSAANQKSVKKRETGSERMGQILPMAVCYLLLFEPFMGFGRLGLRFVAKRQDVELVGLLVTAIGIAFAIWARAHLVANWSAVSIRAGHQFIRTGHPHTDGFAILIYTGMLLAAVGTALVVGQMRGVVAVAICLTAFYLKSSKEERWLAQEFGDNFRTHTDHTGMFLPRLF